MVFVGYPKTGNTWTRYLLGSYVQQLTGSPDVPLFDRPDQPEYPYYFTHAGLRWRAQRARDLSARRNVLPYFRHRVVLLARHPLDVLVSHWHHAARRSIRLFDGELDAFIDDPVWGLEKCLRFYELWAAAGGTDDRVLLSRYEDLHADAHAGLERILAACDLRQQARVVDEAVRRASFAQMQALELEGPPLVYPSTGVPLFSPDAAVSEEARHVRRGEVGGWREHFPVERAAQLDEVVARRLDPWYGYTS